MGRFLLGIVVLLGIAFAAATYLGFNNLVTSSEIVRTPPSESVVASDSKAAADSKATASDASIKAPPTPTDIKFTRPVSSLEDALNMDVFGLSLGMNQSEVLTVLLERGFEKPHDRMGWLDDSGVGLKCPGIYPCGSIGGTQSSENWFAWTRGTLRNGKPKERITPVFYMNENWEQRLYAVWYFQNYEPAIFPGTIADQMVERFGTPALNHSTETEAALSYYIQMSVPKGYVRTPIDDRKESGPPHGFLSSDKNAYRLQRSIINDRIGCLQTEIANFPKPRTAPCVQSLNQQPRLQYIFDALSKGHENQFLRIRIDPSELKITLDGTFLAQAAALSVTEAELVAQLAELKRRRESDASVPDDL